ncbi:olfactory receptor 12D2-like [Microcaecilia unicolor]|uniref:Olfactory receptor n=1 Tax=Microcaecilia unicolor TaxID=1415580 RepID=A0A6P7WXC9_9AMPH|nr:olfactory receptor 12D2-like [Microcaecilia unicolor]
MIHMELWDYNVTLVYEFFLLNFPDHPEFQIFLFAAFVVIYMTTILGNLSILIITRLDPHLQTPMYFFLGILAFIDIFYSSASLYNMFISFPSVKKGISYQGCITQLFFVHFLGTTEACLLAVMGYDRYVAICNPLRYTEIMNRRLCVQMVVTIWFIGFLHALLHAMMISHTIFCGPNQINHFICDVNPMLKLSCSSTYVHELLLFYVTGIIVLSCFTCILISYVFIIFTVVKIHSTKGRLKTFSTCTSHLTVVTLYYSSAGIMYMKPNSHYYLAYDWVIAVFYTTVTPMLNPMIYTLRNKQVKMALIQTICGKLSISKE